MNSSARSASPVCAANAKVSSCKAVWMDCWSRPPLSAANSPSRTTSRHWLWRSYRLEHPYFPPTPDLILMDMSLPVVDGWEATLQLKAALKTRNIPVIALTAHAMSGDREKAMEAGCDDYDIKPVELDRLLGKIAALLARSKGSA